MGWYEVVVFYNIVGVVVCCVILGKSMIFYVYYCDWIFFSSMGQWALDKFFCLTYNFKMNSSTSIHYSLMCLIHSLKYLQIDTLFLWI